MATKQKLRWVTEIMKIDDSVIDTESIRSILEPLWWNVKKDSETSYEESLRQFSYEQGCFLGILWYESEVNNGGHKQFFWNTSGISWNEALNGFKLLVLRPVL